jgi:hypothetical protein
MPEPVDARRQMPTRKCDLCADQMKHIGNVPHSVRGAEIRVFRCDECCLVTTETFDPVVTASPNFPPLFTGLEAVQYGRLVEPGLKAKGK